MTHTTLWIWKQIRSHFKLKMTARMVAAAHASPFRCYTLQDLVDIGDRYKVLILSDFHHTYNIPVQVARLPCSPWIVVGSGWCRRRQRERKQKWGCRSGLLLRIRKPPLPSLYLSNTRSVVHKTDDLELQPAGNCYVRNYCVLIITETWLHPRIPDTSVQLALYNDWCNNRMIIDKHCSPDLEYMSVRYWPFFYQEI